MIEELIEEGQYQVALSRLTDMDDEMTRYYRLVCLNALEDYQRCMQEGAVAKMQANNTYYEVTALYLNALKELEEYEQAINILIEELSMPYIPQQYENLFNAVYDEIILMKQEKNYQLENKSTIMSAQEIGRLLDRDKVNDDLIYKALDQLQQLNIRMIMPEVTRFLKNPHKSSFAKTLIMEILIDQQVDEEFTVVKGDETYYFNGSYSPLVLERECYTLIGKSLSRVLEDDNPTLLSQCLDYLEYYLYTIYPKDIMPEDCDLVAATLHYYVATLQNMPVDPSDIEIDYNCDLSDVEKEILALKQLEC